MHTHLEEKILEQFALFPEDFDDTQKEQILSEIENCYYCKNIYETYVNIYSDTIKNLNNELLEDEELLAKKIYNSIRKPERKLLGSGEKTIIHIEDGNYKIITRPKIFSLSSVKYYFKNYPVASITFGLLFILVLVLGVFTFRTFTKDNNPVTLKLDDFILKAYNREGNLLWTKNVDGIPNRKIDESMKWLKNEKRYISLVDIDADGKNELLLSGMRNNEKLFKGDSLYCFNYDGSLRWVTSPESDEFNYAKSWKRTNWEVKEFFTAKTKKGPKLFVYANVVSYAGTVISTLNPYTGEVTSSIYHSGYLFSQLHFDMDKDGNDEVIFGGASSFGKPCILILKSDYLMGVMPDFYSKNQKFIKGNALYYIQLPVTKLGELLSTQNSQFVSELYKYNNYGIAACTDDVIGLDYDVLLQFAFDSTLTISYITASSAYETLYEKTNFEGKIKYPEMSDYLNAYKDSITYWDGDNFVNYPTKNKYWNQKFQLPLAHK